LRLKGVLFIFFLSGFVALLYEVAWTRTLSLVVGPTVYAFSLMLTSFIVGLALGSFLASKRVDRWGGREDGWSLLCCRLSVLEMLVGLTTLALLAALNRLPLVLAGMVRRYAEDFVRLQAAHFGLLFSLLLVPTLLMGMIFPITAKLYVREKRNLGQQIGHVYATNTAGAIAGSLLAGFLLIPLVGIERTFHVGVGLNLLIGLLALLISLTRRRWNWIGSGFLLAIALLGYGLSPRVDPEILSAGAYKYALYAESANLDLLLKRGELVYHKEGVSATVSVRRRGGEMTLAIVRKGGCQ
jgi:spermidine synthase